MILFFDIAPANSINVKSLANRMHTTVTQSPLHHNVLSLNFYFLLHIYASIYFLLIRTVSKRIIALIYSKQCPLHFKIPSPRPYWLLVHLSLFTVLTVVWFLICNCKFVSPTTENHRKMSFGLRLNNDKYYSNRIVFLAIFLPQSWHSPLRQVFRVTNMYLLLEYSWPARTLCILSACMTMF